MVRPPIDERKALESRITLAESVVGKLTTDVEARTAAECAATRANANDHSEENSRRVVAARGELDAARATLAVAESNLVSARDDLRRMENAAKMAEARRLAAECSEAAMRKALDRYVAEICAADRQIVAALDGVCATVRAQNANLAKANELAMVAGEEPFPHRAAHPVHAQAMTMVALSRQIPAQHGPNAANQWLTRVDVRVGGNLRDLALRVLRKFDAGNVREDISYDEQMEAVFDGRDHHALPAQPRPRTIFERITS